MPRYEAVKSWQFLAAAFSRGRERRLDVRQERRQRCGVIAAATPLKKRGAMIGAHDLFIATY